MAEAGKAADDARLQDEADRNLRADLGDEGHQVQVDVVHGEATLTGTVDTNQHRAGAEASVRKVAGIGFVINNLRVAQEGTTGATG